MEVVAAIVEEPEGATLLLDDAVDDTCRLDDAAEEVEAEDAVEAIVPETADVTFALLRSTLLFPVIELGCQRISHESALRDAGAVAHMCRAPSHTVNPCCVAFPWLTRVRKNDAA